MYGNFSSIPVKVVIIDYLEFWVVLVGRYLGKIENVILKKNKLHQLLQKIMAFETIRKKLKYEANIIQYQYRYPRIQVGTYREEYQR